MDDTASVGRHDAVRRRPTTLQLAVIGALFLVPGLVAPQFVLAIIGLGVLIAAALVAGVVIYRERQTARPTDP